MDAGRIERRLPLGVVIRIDAAKLPVQHFGKMLRRIGPLRKLQHPFVRSPGIQPHETGRHGVLFDHRTGLLAGRRERPLGVIHDQLLAEGVDELTRAARETDAVGIRRGKLHRIADLITPQPVDRGHDHCINFSDPNAFERHDLLAAAKFVISPVIEHQQHIVPRQIVGQREKTLRSVVCFQIGHPLRRDQLGERLAVGRKRHAPVRKKFQIGPHFEQVALARIFQHPAHQHQVPRRHAGKGRDLLPGTLPADPLYLPVEIRNQSRLHLRRPEPTAPERSLTDQHSRQIPDESSVLPDIRTAERQRLAVEDLRLRLGRSIHRRHVPHTERMIPPHGLPRDGNELAAVGRSSRRTGEKRHPPRGCDILLSGQHPLDIRLETLVVLHSDPCGERLGRKMLGNTVPTTELRIGPPRNELSEHLGLHLVRMSPKTIYRLHPAGEIGT